MWNGRDPILKERFFGLTGNQGNHGEDVKEYYFYLDSTPTHSYMKALYKYPQAEFPYQQLLEGNREHDRTEPEYELMDTGVFEGDRYFDVQVEYAKADTDDILIQISIANRSGTAADFHLLPTLWFRNTWTWQTDATKPNIKVCRTDSSLSVIETNHPEIGQSWLYCQAPVTSSSDQWIPLGENPSSEGESATDSKKYLLFTENETNKEQLFDAPNASPYVKDAFHRFVIGRETTAVNPDGHKIGCLLFTNN